MALTYYNKDLVANNSNHHLPGIKKFSFVFRIFGTKEPCIIDRTNTLRTPVVIKNVCPIPVFSPMKRPFEELCNERARELLMRADALGSSIYVLWSGGIDSTLVLVSLLKNASTAQKKNIVVLLSEESIGENPRFYQEHIRGKLRKEPSTMFSYVLGSRHLFLRTCLKSFCYT